MTEFVLCKIHFPRSPPENGNGVPRNLIIRDSIGSNACTWNWLLVIGFPVLAHAPWSWQFWFGKSCIPEAKGKKDRRMGIASGWSRPRRRSRRGIAKGDPTRNQEPTMPTICSSNTGDGMRCVHTPHGVSPPPYQGGIGPNCVRAAAP